MEITAALVKELREATGVGMMDCKKALTETNGDMEAAVDWLRTKGLAKAAKKSSRVAAEGLVAIAVDGTNGAIVDTNCDPDTVDFAIPGNDDASRALELYCSLIAKAAIDGIARSSSSHGADLGAAEVAPEEPALAAETPAQN